jgi:hypothetical protein
LENPIILIMRCQWHPPWYKNLFSDLPAREGYRLLGWGTTPSSSQPVTVYKANEDATFYAIWAEDGYDIQQ